MRKVTIHDIARELDVTFSTVARALKDHPAISEATKVAVKEMAKKLGYQQNMLASSLRSGRSNVIGIIVPGLHTSFFSSVVHGIERVLNENGYSVLLYQTGESSNKERKGVETLLQARVAGIITSIAGEGKSREHFTEIKNRQVPLIFFDRTLEELSVPTVTINDYKGGFLATEHLIKQGYKKIVHITSEYELFIFSERLRGYKDALQHYGLPVNEELIFRGNASYELGSSCVDQLLSNGVDFDAVFALEDYTAMGVVRELQQRGIRVPDQVGVIGFANESLGAFVAPTLSTIDQQTIRMGEETANLFLKLLGTNNFYESTPEKVVLEPILVARQSTKA